MADNISKYLIPGDVPGGFVGEVENQFSHNIYFVSTIYQSDIKCWTTMLGPQFVKKSWFGLSKKLMPMSSSPLVFYRNTENDAKEVHVQVCKIIETNKNEEWQTIAPDWSPPDGIKEPLQRKFVSMHGASLSPDIRRKFRD